MLKLLSIDDFTKKLTPVTSTDFFARSGEFHPEGLFSEEIFGIEDSIDRSKIFSYIDLNATVIHPAAYRIIIRLNRKIEKFLSTEESFIVNDNGEIHSDPNGKSGISSFSKIFSKIKFRGGTTIRDKLIKVLDHSYKQGELFIKILPIIPPDFRPVFVDEKGTLIIDQLNEVYIKLIKKTFQIKAAPSSGPLFDLLNFALQKAIIDHDDYLRTKVQKKTGIVRAAIMGKRIDFSGRAVITPGPDLKVNEIGVPLRMAVKLFEPFIMHQLLYTKRFDKEELNKEVKNFLGVDISVGAIQRIIKAIKEGDKIPESLTKIMFEATEIAMNGRVVLAKRDPVLHAGSYRGFYPKLIMGNTIHICPLVIGGFGADFDGDQMALFHPLSYQSQEECKKKMMNAVGGESMKDVSFEISKEMCVGLYLITKDIKSKTSPISINQQILDNAVDPYISVIYKNKTTTMGKALFNNCLPSDFDFIDKNVAKSDVGKITPILVEKYGDEIAMESLSKLEKLGFKFATIMAPTITLDMLEIPESIKRLKKKLKGATTEEAALLLEEMQKLLIEYLKDTGMYDLVESGSGKGWGQPMQILVAKGLINDPKGNVLAPISSSFSEGLSNTEFFEASTGARTGMMDRTLNTATTGYLTRKLVYMLNSVEASPFLKDCKTTKTVAIRLNSDIINRLHGRFIVVNGKIEEFDDRQHKAGETIHLRTPIYCQSKKICHVCYGRLLERAKTPYVGVFAGHSIGEQGTQGIMKSFHSGGAASLTKRSMLKDIINNDPFLKIPLSDLKKYIEQSENNLVALKNCKITIDMSNYEENTNMQIFEDHIWLNSLISKIEFEDLIFSIVLDYPVDLQIYKQISRHKNIELEYTPDDIIFVVSMGIAGIKKQSQFLERLLGGREIYKDVNHLLQKIYSLFDTSRMDLVHLEVLVSQSLRDKNNLSLPARLGKTWNPVMVNIKDVVFNSGFIQGLAFENINKSIEVGLTSPESLDPSILEKILTGELVEEKRR